MAGQMWIVWNSARSEGVVFDNERDATECSTGMFSPASSSIGEAFAETYDDEPRPVQKVKL